MSWTLREAMSHPHAYAQHCNDAARKARTEGDIEAMVVRAADGATPEAAYDKELGDRPVELWDPVLHKVHWAGSPADLVESNEGDPEVVEALERLARGETRCESVGFFWLRSKGTWDVLR